MKKLFILFFIIAITFVSISFAQAGQTPEELRSEAFTKVKLGTDLMKKASEILAREADEASAKAAVTLYAQAGQMFQEAYNVLNYLGEDYVSASDLEGTSKAMDACMKSINGLKEILIKQQ